MTEKEFLDNIKVNKGIIFKLISLYANSQDEKKDLYQEVLYQSWKGKDSFRQDSKFSTWLYRVCLNTILTHRRKKRIVDFKESIEYFSPTVNHDSVEREQSETLRQAIKLLPEIDRALITLHLDGFENPEISEIMGISVNNTAVKLHRIKEKLSQIVSKI